jgi:hypothetical protein
MNVEPLLEKWKWPFFWFAMAAAGLTWWWLG